jgi:hypothetical protein
MFFLNSEWNLRQYLKKNNRRIPLDLFAIYSTERDIPWSITVIVVMSRRVMGIKILNSCQWSGGNKTPGVNLVIKCVVLQLTSQIRCTGEITFLYRLFFFSGTVIQTRLKILKQICTTHDFTELKLNNHLLFTFYSSIQMNSPFSCYFLEKRISSSILHFSSLNIFYTFSNFFYFNLRRKPS